MRLHLFSSPPPLRHPADDDAPQGGQNLADRETASQNKFKNEDVSARAYALWEKSGYPDGSHLEHWYEAERQLKDAKEGQTADSETAADLQTIIPSPTPTPKAAPATDLLARPSGRRK